MNEDEWEGCEVWLLELNDERKHSSPSASSQALESVADELVTLLHGI